MWHKYWISKSKVLADYKVFTIEVGLYEVNSSSVGSITPVTPPFTIETLLTSDQYLTHYSTQETEPHQHISQTGWTESLSSISILGAVSGSLSKLSELEIQQLLSGLSPVCQPPPDPRHKVEICHTFRSFPPIVKILRLSYGFYCALFTFKTKMHNCTETKKDLNILIKNNIFNFL